MRSIILFVFYTFAVLTTVFAYSSDNVDESCDCRKLKECDSVLSKLIISHTTDAVKHKAFTEYLNLINCGYVRFESLVCCPEKIPSEVLEIVDDTKYWTVLEEQKSIKKLRLAIENAKSSSLNDVDLFPQCGLYWRREDTNSNVTDLGEYPWLALLEYETSDHSKKILCGGALISDQHILTSADCVTTRGNILSSVILGEYDTDANPDCMDEGNGHEPLCVDSVKKYDIELVIIHDKYNDGVPHLKIPMFNANSSNVHSKTNNIALIKLRDKVQFTTYIQPICLPLRQPKYQRFKVAGWGRSLIPNTKGFNKKLLSYLTRCKPSEYQRFEIQRIYDENEHICAAASTNRVEQSCIVDSGGPLMGFETSESGRTRLTVFGVSYMDLICENNGQPQNLPGIFTNVFNYKGWIVENMKL